MSRFKPKDMCIYKGASRPPLLAPGDVIEVESYDAILNKYRMVLAYGYSSTVFLCDEGDLLEWLPLANGQKQISLIDGTSSTKYTNNSSSENGTGPSGYESVKLKRKEAGECEICGTKRAMSVWGLSPCSVCPEPVVPESKR